MAIDSALREVTAAHVSKLHKASLLHGNTKVRQPVAPTGENTMFKNELTVVFYVICCKFKVETDMHGELTEIGKRGARENKQDRQHSGNIYSV